MSRALDNAFVISYAQKPPEPVVTRAKALHQSVRVLLGDQDYLTFLQGSYNNDTALADMNDVDIVAVRKGLRGTNPSLGREMWSSLFGQIEDKLQQDPRFRGRRKREDKCIRLDTEVRIDIVPAIALGNDPAVDPRRTGLTGTTPGDFGRARSRTATSNRPFVSSNGGGRATSAPGRSRPPTLSNVSSTACRTSCSLGSSPPTSSNWPRRSAAGTQAPMRGVPGSSPASRAEATSWRLTSGRRARSSSSASSWPSHFPTRPGR